MKFCKDCRYCQPKRLLWAKDYRFAKCLRLPVDNSRSDASDWLVNTNIKPRPPEFHYCSGARSFENMCGRDAKLFEAKP